MKVGFWRAMIGES